MREKLRREIWNHTEYVIIIIIIIIIINNNNKQQTTHFSVLISCFYTFTHVENLQPDIFLQSFQARGLHCRL